MSPGLPCWQVWGCRRMGRGGRMGHPSLWTHCTPGPSPMGVLHGIGSVILKMIWQKKCLGTAKNPVRSDCGRGSPHRSPWCVPLTHTAGRQRRPSRRGPGLETGAPYAARATLPVRLDGRETVSQNQSRQMKIELKAKYRSSGLHIRGRRPKNPAGPRAEGGEGCDSRRSQCRTPVPGEMQIPATRRCCFTPLQWAAVGKAATTKCD